VAPESAARQPLDTPGAFQATWSQILTSHLFLDIGATQYTGDWSTLPAEPNMTAQTIPVTELSTNYTYRGIYVLNNYGSRHNLSEQRNYRAALSYVTGAHALKVRSPSGIELDKDTDVAAGEVVEVAIPAGAELGLDVSPTRPRIIKQKRRPGWVVPVVVIGSLVIAGGVTAGVLLGTQSAGTKPLNSDLGTYMFSQFH